MITYRSSLLIVSGTDGSRRRSRVYIIMNTGSSLMLLPYIFVLLPSGNEIAKLVRWSKCIVCLSTHCEDSDWVTGISIQTFWSKVWTAQRWTNSPMRYCQVTQYAALTCLRVRCRYYSYGCQPFRNELVQVRVRKGLSILPILGDTHTRLSRLTFVITKSVQVCHDPVSNSTKDQGSSFWSIICKSSLYRIWSRSEERFSSSSVCKAQR